MQRQKKSLSPATLRAKARNVAKAMFSLQKPKGLWAALNRWGWQMLALATQTRKVSNRVRRLFALAQFLLRMEKNHGATFTVKWLKACHVATMRSVARDPVRSLREIEPGLPLPRVTRSGLPIIIGPSDRSKITLGSKSELRFWLSCFSMYRVLKAPVKVKLETITAPCAATEAGIWTFNDFITKKLWVLLRELGVTPAFIRLTASRDKPYQSRAAGPNAKMALSGILADAFAWRLSGLEDILQSYAKMSKSQGVWSAYTDFCGIAERLNALGLPLAWKRGTGVLPFSPSGAYGPGQGTPFGVKVEKGASGPRLGQLAFKEEAAGKLRIFAITDYWTQWLLQPLHVSIFRILSKIPSDATFDQEMGLTRISEIAQKKGCAYSFDLSSATDRIPILIQGHLLSVLTGIKGFGETWAQLLTAREWWFPRNPYGLTGSVRYATGQPMGALSSWAMLALTHHMMVQFAAIRTGHTAWFEDYEILGDDIVICDHIVQQEYRELLERLDVVIGNKVSLISKDPHQVVLEFAKKLTVNGQIASAISFRQLASAQSLAGRVQNLLYFGSQGLLSASRTLYGVVLARFGADASGPLSRIMRRKGFQHGLLGALGSLYRKGMMPLELLVEACANPQDEEFDITSDTLAVPSAQAMSLLDSAFAGSSDLTYPWSHKAERVEIRKDLGISEDMLLLALKARKDLADTYDQNVEVLANSFLTGVTTTKWESTSGNEVVGIRHTSCLHDVMGIDSVLGAQLLSLAEFVLVGSKDPVEYYEELYELLSRDHHEPLPLQEAMTIAEKTILYVASFNIEPAPERAYARDEAWIALRIIRAGWPNVRVWSNPNWAPYAAWSGASD